MSMFVCTPLHTVAVALIHHNPGVVSTAQIVETARTLRTLNNAAAAARYGDKPVILSARAVRETLPEAVQYLREVSPAGIRKIVECFAYQCDEAPADYPGRGMLAKLKSRVSTIPGDSPIWSI